MKIVKLRLKKDGQEELLDELELVVGLGARGDEKALKNGGDAKLILADEKELVCYRNEEKGLCVGRFRPHISTEDLDYKMLVPGTVIKIGSAEIEVTGLSKKCFPECEFVKNGLTCGIKFNCTTAKVKKSGHVFPGDQIFLIN